MKSYVDSLIENTDPDLVFPDKRRTIGKTILAKIFQLAFKKELLYN